MIICQHIPAVIFCFALRGEVGLVWLADPPDVDQPRHGTNLDTT